MPDCLAVRMGKKSKHGKQRRDRGSGTNGYIQRNLAAVRPLTSSRAEPDRSKDRGAYGKRTSEEIQEHNRKRGVYVRCCELREQLEKQGVSIAEIESRVLKLNSELMAETARPDRKGVAGGKWDSHVVAQDKQRKWREALNIPDDTSRSHERNRKQLVSREVSGGSSGRTHGAEHRRRDTSEEASDHSRHTDNESSSAHSNHPIPSPRRAPSTPPSDHTGKRGVNDVAEAPCVAERETQSDSELSHQATHGRSKRRHRNKSGETGKRQRDRNVASVLTNESRELESVSVSATKGHIKRHNGGSDSKRQSRLDTREVSENVAVETRHKNEKKKIKKEKERKDSKPRRQRECRSVSEDTSSEEAVSPPRRKRKKKGDKKRHRDRSVSGIPEDTSRHKRHKRKKSKASRKRRHETTSEDSSSESDTFSDTEDTSEESVSHSDSESSEVTPPPKRATRHKKKKTKKHRRRDTSPDTSDYESPVPKKKVSRRHKQDTIAERKRHKHRKQKKKVSEARRHKKRREKKKQSSSQSESESEVSVEELIELRHSRKKKRCQDTESEQENVRNAELEYESGPEGRELEPSEDQMESGTEATSESIPETRTVRREARTHRDTKIGAKSERHHKKRAKDSKRRHRSKNRNKAERKKKSKKNRRRHSVSSSCGSSSEEDVSRQNRRGNEVASKNGVKRHRRDSQGSEEQIPVPSEPLCHVVKKKQRIERKPSSSSEQASIPEQPPVAMENSTQSSEETFQEVPVVTKRRGGKKGMRELDLFELEALRQRKDEETQLTNQRADPVPPKKFLAPRDTSVATGFTEAPSPPPHFHKPAPLGTEHWTDKWNVSDKPWTTGTETNSAPVSYPAPLSSGSMFGPALPLPLPPLQQQQPEIVELEFLKRSPSSCSKSATESRGDSDMSMSPASERSHRSRQDPDPSAEDRPESPAAEQPALAAEQLEVLSEKSQSAASLNQQGELPIRHASSLSSLSSARSDRRTSRTRARSPRRSPRRSKDRWGRRSRDRSYRRYRSHSRSRSRSDSLRRRRWHRRSRSRSSSRGYRAPYERRRQFGRYEDRYWRSPERDSRDRWGRRVSYDRYHGSRYDSRDKDRFRRRESPSQWDRYHERDREPHWPRENRYNRVSPRRESPRRQRRRSRTHSWTSDSDTSSCSSESSGTSTQRDTRRHSSRSSGHSNTLSTPAEWSRSPASRDSSGRKGSKSEPEPEPDQRPAPTEGTPETKRDPSPQPEGPKMCPLETHSPARSDPATPVPLDATSEPAKCEVLVPGSVSPQETHSPDTAPLQEETGTGTNQELAPSADPIPD